MLDRPATFLLLQVRSILLLHRCCPRARSYNTGLRARSRRRARDAKINEAAFDILRPCRRGEDALPRAI
jgi:hypothetical protein